MKIVPNPIPALPAFTVLCRVAPFLRGTPPVPRYFGKTLYSPRHHLDDLGRPIPVRRSQVRGARYVPSVEPTVVLDLGAPPPKRER